MRIILGSIYLARVEIPSPKIVINHIGSAVSEIIRYKQTDRQIDRHHYKDSLILTTFVKIALCLNVGLYTN